MFSSRQGVLAARIARRHNQPTPSELQTSARPRRCEFGSVHWLAVDGTGDQRRPYHGWVGQPIIPSDIRFR